MMIGTDRGFRERFVQPIRLYGIFLVAQKIVDIGNADAGTDALGADVVVSMTGS